MSLEKWLVQPGEAKVIDLELVRSVKIGMIGGQIDVIGTDEPGARVEVHSVQGKDLKVSIDGDTLEIDHPQLRWDNFLEVFASFRGTAKADISLMVPRDVALKFGVISASGLVSGLRSDARISTVSGDILVDGVTGDIDLNGVNGELSVRDHSGSITAHTVAGSITASGSIRRFSADAVNGDVFLDLDGTPDEVNSNTVSGDLTVRVEEGLGARYRINTVSGTLHLDDSVIKGTLGKGYNGTSGSLDGAWVDINANSVSGDISLVRKTRASRADAGATASVAAPAAAAFGTPDSLGTDATATAVEDAPASSETQAAHTESVSEWAGEGGATVDGPAVPDGDGSTGSDSSGSASDHGHDGWNGEAQR